MTQGNRTRNQHFVPRMLLRRFAVPGTNQRAVSVFDLDTRRVTPLASLAGQCAHPFFYGEDGTVEKWLSTVEGAANAAIEEIVRTHSLPARGSIAWRDILRFIAVQHGRTPAVVRKHEQERRTAIEEGRKLARNAADEEVFADLEKKMTPDNPVVESVHIHASLVPVIQDLDDLLVINDTGFQLVVSDIGVITHNQWTTGITGLGGDGLASRGTMIFLPLSPRHLLLKYDSSVYHMRGAEKNTLRVTDVAQIKSLNYLQIVFAERNLYFSGDSHTGIELAKLAAHANRAPLASMVRTERLVDRTGGRNILHTYSQRPKLVLALDWMQFKKSVRDIPLNERAQQFRPAAVAETDIAPENSRYTNKRHRRSPRGTLFRKL